MKGPTFRGRNMGHPACGCARRCRRSRPARTGAAIDIPWEARSRTPDIANETAADFAWPPSQTPRVVDAHPSFSTASRFPPAQLRRRSVKDVPGRCVKDVLGLDTLETKGAAPNSSRSRKPAPPAGFHKAIGARVLDVPPLRGFLGQEDFFPPLSAVGYVVSSLTGLDRD